MRRSAVAVAVSGWLPCGVCGAEPGLCAAARLEPSKQVAWIAAKRRMEPKGFKMTALRRWMEPGSLLRGGSLETTRIDIESLAEGNGECKSFKSSVGGTGG